MATFLHGGDFGDLIFALPAMRALGGGTLYLSETKAGREPLNAARRAAIVPLLEKIDYLKEIRVHQDEKVDYDFTELRNKPWPEGCNLAEAQLEHCGLSRDLANEAWIDRTAFLDDRHHFPIVVHRSSRFHNLNFPWKEFVEKFGRQCSFIGFIGEYLNFSKSCGSITYRPTGNLLEVATLIANSQAFVGNQSIGHAIAEAMKIPTMLEFYPALSDCDFTRDNLLKVDRPHVRWGWLEERMMAEAAAS